MSQRSSNAFWWAVIGFFLGVAATLGAFMWLGDGDRSQDVAATAPRSVRISASRAKASRPVTERAAEGQPATDEQVAEDAAAAGMTSRARRPSE